MNDEIRENIKSIENVIALLRKKKQTVDNIKMITFLERQIEELKEGA